MIGSVGFALIFIAEYAIIFFMSIFLTFIFLFSQTIRIFHRVAIVLLAHKKKIVCEEAALIIMRNKKVKKPIIQ
jgi:hypothetical protein